MKKAIIVGVLALIGAGLGLVFSLRSQVVNNNQPETGIPQEKTIEQKAEEGWMAGCVPHTMEEAKKLTDIVDEEAATAKAALYCACDWSYMRDSMGLSLEDIASIGQEGSRGSSAIVQAQNYCYERYKGNYYP